MYFYWAIFGVTAFAGLAMTVGQSLWNNVLLLCYILLSGVVGLGCHEAVTVWVDEKTGGEYTYMLDMPLLWATYAVMFVLLKVVGAGLSKTRIKFLPPVEQYGAPAVGLVCALLLACFAMATAHTAPFGKDFLGGKLVHSASDLENAGPIGSPDVSFVAIAAGALQPAGLGAADSTLSAKDWVLMYEDHREAFDEASKAKGFMGRAKR